jgi:hypothetical protein
MSHKDRRPSFACHGSIYCLRGYPQLRDAACDKQAAPFAYDVTSTAACTLRSTGIGVLKKKTRYTLTSLHWTGDPWSPDFSSGELFPMPRDFIRSCGTTVSSIFRAEFQAIAEMTGRLWWRFICARMEQNLGEWRDNLKYGWVTILQSLKLHLGGRFEEAVAEDLWECEESDAEVEARRSRLMKQKHAYLYDLGCRQPEHHDTSNHTCSLGNNAAVFHIVLDQYHRREVPLLRAMREKLPGELVANIFSEVVLNNAPKVVHLRSLDDIQHLRNNILSDHIPETVPYHLLLERAILESLPVSLDITFESGDTEGKVTARLPDFALTVLPHIRTLVVRIYCEESVSEASIGMASLRLQLLPFRLRVFVVGIVTGDLGSLMEGMNHSEMMQVVLMSFREIAPGRRVTYREECEAMVEAVRIAEIGRTQYFRFEIPPRETCRVQPQVSMTAITSVMSAANIVECAVRRVEERPISAI